MQTNKSEVKRKVVDLLLEYERNVPLSPAEKEKFDLERTNLEWKKMADKYATAEKKLAAQERNKVLKRLGHVSREVEMLSSKMSKLKNVDEMTDDEII